MKPGYGYILAAALVAMSLTATAQPIAGDELPLGKRLVEYGWDVPFPDFIQANIATMQQRPFDGIVFKLHGGGNVLTPTAWDPAQFQKDYDILPTIPWGRLTSNFVIMWAATDQDWFDDAQWEAIANNVRLATRAAALAKCVGICFDAEPYGTNPWRYADAAHRDTKTFADYEAIARKRGAQFIQAVEAEMPGAEILTFFLTTYVAEAVRPMPPEQRAEMLGAHHYGLWPAFLNGMLDGASPAAQFVDGNESAYYYTQSSQYFERYNFIMNQARWLVAPELWQKYRAQVQAGQALYVDQYFGLRAQKVLGHFMPPEDQAKWFEHNVYWAIHSTDKYVWCYSERMNWWQNQEIPAGSEDAIRRARAKLIAGEPLGFDLAPAVAAAQAREQEAKQAEKQ